ncbi:YrhK family protein [Halospina sp. K52047b]|uniref:YrhK family protein n=1 Tax=Halospina sp. K52047b TaxID=2614160 RepID=UPI001CE43E6E|nr:YrhK family protein [Halospina sp. K52047b]
MDIERDTRNAIKVLVQDYSWVHLTLGLLGNLTFFIGSALFLPSLEAYKVLGVWLFIIGSFLMLIGSIGRFLVDIWEEET